MHTHSDSNQPPPFEGADLLACDAALQNAIDRHVLAFAVCFH